MCSATIGAVREAALPRAVTDEPRRARAGDRAPAPAERALVAAAQQGSAEAFAELFRRHWPHAHRAAWLVTHDAAAAEDIAQEAFLAAIRALHRFDRRRPFGPWLHRIVVNRAIDWTRARQLRGEVELGEAATRVEPVDPSDVDRLAAAIAALPPEQR